MASLIDSIINVESGGDSQAKNPNSSASGAGQFLAGTWLDTLAKHRPDITGSQDELLALRNDPALSKEMTAAYAADNAGVLSRAGLPTTDGSLYLSHFAGPGGAVKVLQADPTAPVGSILGAGVVKANPFLAGMTAGDLQAWAAKKVGGSAPQVAGAPQTPASPPGAPLNLIPQQAPPIFAQQPQAAPQEAPSAFAQMPAPQMAQAPPIFAPPRKQLDLSKLRAAFPQPSFYGTKA